MGYGARWGKSRRSQPARFFRGIGAPSAAKQPGLVRNWSSERLPARFRECAYVQLVDQVSLDEKQHGTCATVSSEGQTRGCAGFAELERQVAWSAGAVR